MQRSGIVEQFDHTLLVRPQHQQLAGWLPIVAADTVEHGRDAANDPGLPGPLELVDPVYRRDLLENPTAPVETEGDSFRSNWLRSRT